MLNFFGESAMHFTICEKKSNKIYDNINLCELCYPTNIKHLNLFNANLEYEPPNCIIDNIHLGSQKSGVDGNKLFELNIRYAPCLYDMLPTHVLTQKLLCLGIMYFFECRLYQLLRQHDTLAFPLVLHVSKRDRTSCVGSMS